MSGHFTLVLFDLDGVLVDSTKAMNRAVDATLASVGVGSPPREIRQLLYGPPLIVGFGTLLGEMGADPSLGERCAGIYRDCYRSFVIAESQVFDGMQSVLDRLLGVTPMVIATSKPSGFVEPLLKFLGVEAYFTGIAAPESEAQAEPKDATIARALHDHHAGERPVYVGDTREDVTAANANNIPCAAALWGFGTEPELRRAHPAWLVRTPAELASLLCDAN